MNGGVVFRVIFTNVVSVADGNEVKVGAPCVKGASITATVVSHHINDKVRILKMRRRKHSIKGDDHRQNYTELKIDSIAA